MAATKEERIFEGIAVSPGITCGRARIVNRQSALPTEARNIPISEVEPEVQRFLRAVELSRRQLTRIQEQVAKATDDRHAAIIGAQTAFLDDPAMIDATVDAIRTERKNAEYLYQRRINEALEVFKQFEDQYMRFRDSDIFDISNRVISNMAEQAHRPPTVDESDAVVVAHDLAPSDTTLLLKKHVRALVMEKGGPTSHTAIMAKALETPAVVGVAHITAFVEDGDTVIVDGLSGRIIVNPLPTTAAAFEEEREAYEAWERELAELRESEAETIDGYLVQMRANIELPEELGHVAQHGAHGIGLFRTEFLFMNRGEPPSEEEQFETYRRAVEAVSPNSVVFRTLDLGGDKFASRAEPTYERNPFLGQRAIRLCLERTDIFRAQLRAMLRASAFGSVRILIPMISGVEELIEVKKHLKAVQDDLEGEGIAFDRKTELGTMIEVPSAAVIADILARECDFFSIGTNDLIQYGLAVDRGNESVAYLYEPLHPAILRMLRMTMLAARHAGIPVTVCGEVAADPLMATILVGMGADELSMSALCIPAVKRVIRSIRLSDAKALAEEILNQTTIDGVRQVIRVRLKAYLASNRTHRWLRFAQSRLVG